MSCVLRITSDGPAIGTLVPYRFEQGTAHIQVSRADFDDVPAQMRDATVFLQHHQTALQHALSQDGAEGVIDFAVEWRDVAVQVDGFPAELVRLAGQLGLALMLSHHPST